MENFPSMDDGAVSLPVAEGWVIVPAGRIASVRVVAMDAGGAR